MCYLNFLYYEDSLNIKSEKFREFFLLPENQPFSSESVEVYKQRVIYQTKVSYANCCRNNELLAKCAQALPSGPLLSFVKHCLVNSFVREIWALKEKTLFLAWERVSYNGRDLKRHGIKVPWFFRNKVNHVRKSFPAALFFIEHCDKETLFLIVSFEGEERYISCFETWFNAFCDWVRITPSVRYAPLNP